MELPNLLASWQWGYFYFGVIFISFLFVSSLQIVVRVCPKYESIVGYALALMVIGMLSILLDMDIVNKALEVRGVLLSQIISLTVCLMMLMLVFVMIFCFMFLARDFCWNEREFTSITFFSMVMSVISVIFIIIFIVNSPRVQNEVKLLRGTIFIVIPGLTAVAVMFGILLRRVIVKRQQRMSVE